MGDLSSAAVGTKIKIPRRGGTSFIISKVTKITASSVMCGEMRFRKSDGLLVGSTGAWSTIYGRIASDDDILEHRIACAKSKLQSIKVTAENLETIERLIVESDHV